MVCAVALKQFELKPPCCANCQAQLLVVMGLGLHFTKIRQTINDVKHCLLNSPGLLDLPGQKIIKITIIIKHFITVISLNHLRKEKGGTNTCLFVDCKSGQKIWRLTINSFKNIDVDVDQNPRIVIDLWIRFFTEKWSFLAPVCRLWYLIFSMWSIHCFFKKLNCFAWLKKSLLLLWQLY